MHITSLPVREDGCQRRSEHFRVDGRGVRCAPGELLVEAKTHLETARNAHASKRMINLRLATAIVETIGRLIDQWDSVPALSRSWLIGAICYFSRSDDDEPDFSSPIGFEDDVEVLNACLRFARLSDLCINVEDFDDV